MTKHTRFPGWRTMTAAERINAKHAAIWAEARALERVRRSQGLTPNLGLLALEA